MALVVLSSVQGRDRRVLRVTFDQAVKQVAAANADDALNPANYDFRAGPTLSNTQAFFTPTPLSVKAVTTSVVDVTVDDDLTYAIEYECEVTGVENPGGESMNPALRTVTFTSADPRNPNRKFDLASQFMSRHSLREDETGDLKRFLSLFQDITDILFAEKDRFQTILDIDTAPEAFVDAILSDLGNPFRFDLDLNGKRKLARILVPLYKQKGTIEGLRNSIRFFLGIEIVDVVEILEECLLLGISELGLDWILCPSDSFSRFAFKIIVDKVLTAEEEAQMTEIVEYMKPAHTHFQGFIEPGSPEFIDHWEIGFSDLGVETLLH